MYDTRPHINYTVKKAGYYMAQPRDSPCRLVKQLIITAFADADWGSNLEDRRSTSGYVVYFGCNLVSWRSREKPVVALSTSEAEYSENCKYSFRDHLDIVFVRRAWS